jgi:hypothetical protein
MLFMVALLTMVPLVVSFILVLGMLLVLQFGTVELLYCASYYTYRGGRSSGGAACGVFFVAADTGAGSTRWYIGAALSFKTYIIIYYIHGETT